MHVLVGDDDPELLRLMSSALQREGHAVDTAASGQDALWLAAEVPYDVLVLDINMPPPDGVEVVRRLRQQENWTPVLLLTGRGEVADRVRGLDAGADDYLLKPFAVEELRARLRALVRRGSPARPTVLHVGGLTIDPAARSVTRNGVTILLTRREYALLELLARNAGQVVSRPDITAKLWDFASDVGSNVVDVTLRRLREKVDKPFGTEDLVTVRGVGYMLRAVDR